MMISGGSRRERSSSVAASPSILGIRMSISTTSGLCSLTAPTTSEPSATSATTATSGDPASIIDSPARTSASSSTTSTRIGEVISTPVATPSAGSHAPRFPTHG